METVNFAYNGIYTNLKPGSLAISQGQTTYHLVTTHVGKSNNGNPFWTEAGVIRSLGTPAWRYFTYDNDEGGWVYHGNTSENTWSTYNIYVTTTHEAAGWKYITLINGAFARGGHLPSYTNQADQCNEAWSDTNTWTNDTNSACHDQPKLYNGGSQTIWWDNTVPTHPWTIAPEKYQMFMLGPAYRYITWVQN